MISFMESVVVVDPVATILSPAVAKKNTKKEFPKWMLGEELGGSGAPRVHIVDGGNGRTEINTVLKRANELGSGTFGAVRKVVASDGATYSVKTTKKSMAAVDDPASPRYPLPTSKRFTVERGIGSESLLGEELMFFMLLMNAQHLGVGLEEGVQEAFQNHFITVREIYLSITEKRRVDYDPYRRDEIRARDVEVFYVYEYCEGVLSEDKSYLSESELANLSVGLLRALDALKKQGLAHRDVKLENVFRHAGKYKLADFGLSQFPEDEVYHRGTLPYLAPEYWRGDAPLSGPKLDMYAVKTVICEAAAKPPKFAEGGVHEVESWGSIRASLGKSDEEQDLDTARYWMDQAKADYRNALQEYTKALNESKLQGGKSLLGRFPFLELMGHPDPEKRMDVSEALIMAEKIQSEIQTGQAASHQTHPALLVGTP